MSYAAGSVVAFSVTYRQATGQLVDPQTPLVHIDPPGLDTTEITVPMNRLSEGRYQVDWTVPAGWPLGNTEFWFTGVFDDGEWVSDSESFSVIEAIDVVNGGAIGLYCTVEEIRARLPRLTDAAMEYDQVLEAIRDAGAEIDAALNGIYPVPFSPVPQIINTIAKDLVAAEVLTSAYSGDGTSEEQPLFKRYLKRGQDRLERLKSGDDVIPGLHMQSKAGRGYATPQHGPAPLAAFRPSELVQRLPYLTWRDR